MKILALLVALCVCVAYSSESTEEFTSVVFVPSESTFARLAPAGPEPATDVFAKLTQESVVFAAPEAAPEAAPAAPEAAPEEALPAPKYTAEFTFGSDIIGVSVLKRFGHYGVFYTFGGQYLRADINETYDDISADTEADCLGLQGGIGYSKQLSNNWRGELGISIGSGLGYFESEAEYLSYVGDDDGLDLYLYNEVYGNLVYKNVGFKVGMGVFESEESFISGISYNW
jgi:hypothetical protein